MRSTLAGAFFLSGLATVVCQLVWQRLLAVHYGIGAASTALILSVYLLGLAAGALAGGAIADRLPRRIGISVLIQLLLGLFGFLSLPLSGWMGAWTAGASYPVALGCIALFLAIPTFLTGMALPVLVRIFADDGSGFLANLALLASVHALGAAVGAVAGTFLLISFVGLDGALHTAAAIHAVLAFAIAGSTRRSPTPVSGVPAPQPSSRRNSDPGRGFSPVLVGAGALMAGYLLVWLRILDVVAAGSIYAAPVATAIYFAGLAAGALAVRTWQARRPIPDRHDLALLLQFGVSVAALAAMILFLRRIETAAESSGLAALLAWPWLLLFAPAILQGAALVVATAAVRTSSAGDGRTVGRGVFAVVAGAVGGGVATAFGLLPWLGSEQVMGLLTVAGATSLLGARRVAGSPFSPLVRWSAVAGVAATAWLALPEPTELWRGLHPSPDGIEIHVEEGIHGVVVTRSDANGSRTVVNGVARGGLSTDAVGAMVAESAAYTPVIRHILVVGHGTDSTTEALAKLSGVRSITLVEPNEALLRSLLRLPRSRSLLSDPLLRIVVDDPRRFLNRNPERYDLIVMNAQPDRTAGSNQLRSAEFFRLLASRLAPGGTLRLRIDETRVLPKTVATVFAHVRQYELETGSGSMIASRDELTRDDGRYRAELRRVLDFRTDQHRDPWTLRGGRDFAFAAGAGYPPNGDLRPLTEYHVGLDVRTRLGNPALLRLIDEWSDWRYALPAAVVEASVASIQRTPRSSSTKSAP